MASVGKCIVSCCEGSKPMWVSLALDMSLALGFLFIKPGRGIQREKSVLYR